MANYTSADLVKAQLKFTELANSAELKFRDPAVFKRLLASQSLFFENIDAIRSREDRLIEVNYHLRASRGLGAARAHNHTGVKSDSGIVTPAWSSKTDKFYYSIKQADNSIYSLEEQLARNEIRNVVANFANGMETAAAAYLFAQRSQVNGANVGGSFNAANFAFEITEATEGNRAMQITEGVMDYLKYRGMGYQIFCDQAAYQKFQYAAAQGAGNNVNLSFQYQNLEFIQSPEMNDLAIALGYTNGFWEVVPVGLVAAMTWIPRQNREGNGNYWPLARYGSFINPIDGQTMAVHEYATSADDSINNGYIQDVQVQLEYSYDVCFEHAPLSTANDSPIQAFAFV